MDPLVLAILIAAVLFIALLYSSVGHGGGSGYIAAMALVGVAPFVMKPTALALNVVVAGIAIFKFYRAGAFSWSVFWPFALASVPLAFIGGHVVVIRRDLPDTRWLSVTVFRLSPVSVYSCHRRAY